MSEQQGDEQGYMNMEEAMRYTRLGRTFLTEARKDGALKSMKLGRAVRFRKEDLDEFMRSGYKAPYGAGTPSGPRTK